MKVSLTVKERILLGSNVLPSESDFPTLKVVRKLKEQIGLSETELTAIDMKMVPNDQGGTRFSWDTSKEEPKEFEFGDKAAEIIRSSLKKLSDNGRAKIEHLSLFEKFPE